jgi:glutamate 5-kinase
MNERVTAMPAMKLRQDVLSQAQRVVVKMGTQLLADKEGRLDVAYLSDVARQVHALRQRGLEVTLVSSGAIGAGCGVLKLKKRPLDVAALQAVAAIGQPRLMDHMAAAFTQVGLTTAQVLLTRADFDDRDRFLNLRNCVTHLHQLGVVPILNENDTVAVDELRFGDNDMLAALMCNALSAQAMLLLTGVDGVLDDAKRRIPMIDDVLERITAAKRAPFTKSTWGTGGIVAKLEAVRLVVESGDVAVIANGREPDVMLRIFAGEDLGTIFLPAPRKLDSRQRWIGLTKRPAGVITIDDGAAVALRDRGKSLLASGVSETTGRFERGDILLVRDTAGREIARGMSNYSADELRLIMGKKSGQFEKLLGRPAYAEVIHRDHLVLVSG